MTALVILALFIAGLILDHQVLRETVVVLPLLAPHSPRDTELQLKMQAAENYFSDSISVQFVT